MPSERRHAKMLADAESSASPSPSGGAPSGVSPAANGSPRVEARRVPFDTTVAAAASSASTSGGAIYSPKSLSNGSPQTRRSNSSAGGGGAQLTRSTAAAAAAHKSAAVATHDDDDNDDDEDDETVELDATVIGERDIGEHDENELAARRRRLQQRSGDSQSVEEVRKRLFLSLAEQKKNSSQAPNRRTHRVCMRTNKQNAANRFAGFKTQLFFVWL